MVGGAPVGVRSRPLRAIGDLARRRESARHAGICHRALRLDRRRRIRALFRVHVELTLAVDRLPMVGGDCAGQGFALMLMDRLIIALMIKPIERDLGPGHDKRARKSAVGAADAFFYVTAFWPLGRLTQSRPSRRPCCLQHHPLERDDGDLRTKPSLDCSSPGSASGEVGRSPAAISQISDFLPMPKRRMAAHS